ncbi:MAG: exodeoxyribonuclease VII large subunit [Pyrinomonadaceae bacterium]|nr:exodeoxyribonuclease VII large subunit [Pyrinomonadaceae bacterium]
MEDSLLAALFGVDERRPLSVSELSTEIRESLERQFPSVWVEGEITNFHAASSGHWYFSLTDGKSFIKACCFKGSNYRIRFKPSDGLQVSVRGKLSIYGPRGELQIVVDSLEPVGEGALAVAFEQIKAKLQREGLFDEAIKRPLPSHPRRVGVVTSPTGAALQDILTVLKRRARSVGIVVIPTLVQGDRAGQQIAEAIGNANRYSASVAASEQIDVLIVGRGGGSAEDLWAFNEEQVARAIRASNIPVISAVGHEIDFTIADLVADHRAPTPSAAAEIVAKAEADVIEHLRRSTAELLRSMQFKMLSIRTDVQNLTMNRVFSAFPQKVRELGYHIDELSAVAEDSVELKLSEHADRLSVLGRRLSPVGLAAKVGENRKRLAVIEQRSLAAGSKMTVSREHVLETVMASLDAMSPLRVLDRGYSLTRSLDGRILRDAAGVAPGDRINIKLAKGELEANVTEVNEAG